MHLLRIDIRNLWLPGIAELTGQQVLGIGKHVCGAATDLALKCLCQTQLEDAEADQTNCADPPYVTGIGIALCCRHVCTWNDYVDQEWVLQAGFSPAEFDVMARMSTWVHQPDIEKKLLGEACQYFLDRGRVRFLRNRGFDARIEDYVGIECTKENKVLIASKCAV